MADKLPVREAGFQETVIETAQLHGWIIAHFRPSRTADGGWVTAVSADGKGFPDLFLLRPQTGHRLAVELKVGNNKKTPEQEAWLMAMELCGIPAFLWTPCDWIEIESVLTNGAEPGQAQAPETVRTVAARIFDTLRRDVGAKA